MDWAEAIERAARKVGAKRGQPNVFVDPESTLPLIKGEIVPWSAFLLFMTNPEVREAAWEARTYGDGD